MKNATKVKQILEESEITGAMMVYKPMNAEETKKVADWVAERKMLNNTKKNKNPLEKVSA